MDDQSRVLMATLMGAVAGGIWGWLYLTEPGRRMRSQIEPKLDDFMRELSNVRGRSKRLVRRRTRGGARSTRWPAAGTQGRWSA